MQHIHSKDIFMLIRDALKLYDRRLMDHGSKVAYYVYKMLQFKGGYEEYELADIIFLVTLHDIGAYKTEKIDDMLRFETKDYKPHAIFGFLFMRGLSSVGEMAKVILHHHTDYAQLGKMEFIYKDLASYVNLADKVDLFSEAAGEKFNMDIFQKQLGTKFSKEAYELFIKADKEYDLFGKVKSREYKEELERLIEYFILPNEDKEKLLEFLMFTLALKSETAITDAAMVLVLCEKLGMELKLSDTQVTSLRYAGYVHDIGLLALPPGWIENPAGLSGREMDKLKQHSLLTEKLLQNRMKPDVVVIAATHHERPDGSGYPRKLTEKQMNISQMILQFAVAVVVLLNPRPGRPEPDRQKIIDVIKKKAESGTLSLNVAGVFLENIDEIIEYCEVRSKEILAGYRKIKIQYDNAMSAK